MTTEFRLILLALAFVGAIIFLVTFNLMKMHKQRVLVLAVLANNWRQECTSNGKDVTCKCAACESIRSKDALLELAIEAAADLLQAEWESDKILGNYRPEPTREQASKIASTVALSPDLSEKIRRLAREPS
ncbi:MAG: hypothetical protein F4Z53_00065 [Acidimicrobiales bacterium]|nr:hypothetical protein [Acidimicrobiales bacterium]MXX41435.1 hypothetical protein [Acidimicrobiales bacterium]MYB81059.1 hypothetical protein [Acidimicrobiales bacterium]MYD34516.1 hypothetical protein [Acidimicrobiales bacterium]MYI09534.1 hypothetical protein [Acidimicrobiales bacterium]